MAEQVTKLSLQVWGLLRSQMQREYFEVSLQSIRESLFSLLRLISIARSKNQIELLFLRSLRVYTIEIRILWAIQEVSVLLAVQWLKGKS